MKQVALVLVAALAGSAGCSMALQSHLPDRPSSPPPTTEQVATCSTSHLLPWIDVGIMAAEFAVTAVALSTGEGEARTSLATAALGAGFMQGVSAGNGFKRAAACKRAKAGSLPQTALAF